MIRKERAILALEDGTVYRGYAFGHRGETVGEVVFNTSMTGYQEIMTDPSYNGQIVTITYPHVGNYGVAIYDMESNKPYVRASSPANSVPSTRTTARSSPWNRSCSSTASCPFRASTRARWCAACARAAWSRA